MAEAVRVAQREVPCLAKIMGGGMPVGAFGRRPNDPTGAGARVASVV